MKKPLYLVIGAILLNSSVFSGVHAEVFIAGEFPSQRPAHAGVISSDTPSPAKYQRLLHGLSAPYPASFRWIEQQGAWYTPFSHPGMPGPYDIRNWHMPR
jgi:hypothetical protein